MIIILLAMIIIIIAMKIIIIAMKIRIVVIMATDICSIDSCTLYESIFIIVTSSCFIHKKVIMFTQRCEILFSDADYPGHTFTCFLSLPPSCAAA